MMSRKLFEWDSMERRLEADLPEFFLPGVAARRAIVPPTR
jgi:hypothetical protein